MNFHRVHFTVSISILFLLITSLEIARSSRDNGDNYRGVFLCVLFACLNFVAFSRLPITREIARDVGDGLKLLFISVQLALLYLSIYPSIYLSLSLLLYASHSHLWHEHPNRKSALKNPAAFSGAGHAENSLVKLGHENLQYPNDNPKITSRKVESRSYLASHFDHSRLYAFLL